MHDPRHRRWERQRVVVVAQRPRAICILRRAAQGDDLGTGVGAQQRHGRDKREATGPRHRPVRSLSLGKIQTGRGRLLVDSKAQKKRSPSGAHVTSWQNPRSIAITSTFALPRNLRVRERLVELQDEQLKRQIEALGNYEPIGDDIKNQLNNQ